MLKRFNACFRGMTCHKVQAAEDPELCKRVSKENYKNMVVRNNYNNLCTVS